MKAVLAVALLSLSMPSFALCAPVTYSLRDAHFFGGVPGDTREITQTGTFTPASGELLPYVFSTGGPAPTVFDGTASNQGTPFELRAAPKYRV